MSLVLGIDPGFGACGWALVDVNPLTEEVRAAGVIRTKKDPRKKTVKAMDDRVERAREIARELRKLLDGNIATSHGGLNARPTALCVEAFGAPPSAPKPTYLMMGLVWGVIAALATERNLPVVQVRPQDVRRLILGRTGRPGHAGKEDVKLALYARFGQASLDALFDDVSSSYRVHAFDAMGIVLGCYESEVLRLLRQRGV